MRPKLQPFAALWLLISALGRHYTYLQAMSELAALVNRRVGGGSFGIADGSQQMLLLPNTKCVILHHILQQLIHQHFAVLLHTITHTPSRNPSALFNNIKHVMHMYESLVKLFQIINHMETGWLLYTFINVLVLDTFTDSAGPSDMHTLYHTQKFHHASLQSLKKTWLL